MNTITSSQRSSENLFIEALELMPMIQAGNRLPDGTLPLRTFTRLVDALKHEHIQINNALTNIFTIDLDEEFHSRYLATGEVPDFEVCGFKPLGLTFTRSGNVHIYFRIRTIGGSQAAEQYARAVREAMTIELGGDLGYENRTARNPFLHPERTIWFEGSDVYDVSDIEAEMRAQGKWKRKRSSRKQYTGYGFTSENGIIFEAVKDIMKGKTTEELDALDVDASQAICEQVNALFGHPLHDEEIIDMAERMTRYWQGRPGSDDWSKKEKAVDFGRKGGQANTGAQRYHSMKNLELINACRQEKAEEVYGEFMELMTQGVSVKEAARRLPVSLSTLKRWKNTPPSSWALTEAPEPVPEAITPRRMIKVVKEPTDMDVELSDDDFAAALGVSEDKSEAEYEDFILSNPDLSHAWTYEEWCEAKSWDHFIPTVKQNGVLQLFAGLRGDNPMSPGGRDARAVYQERYERALAAVPAGAPLPPVLEAIEMGFFTKRLLNFLPRKQPRKNVTYPVMLPTGAPVTFRNAEYAS